MKLLGSRKEDADQGKGREDVPKLESVEVVLVHCILVNSNYQQAAKVLFTVVPNRKFGQLINILTTFINNAKHNKYRVFIH